VRRFKYEVLSYVIEATPNVWAGVQWDFPPRRAQETHNPSRELIYEPAAAKWP